MIFSKIQKKKVPKVVLENKNEWDELKVHLNVWENIKKSKKLIKKKGKKKKKHIVRKT